jgi:hypothetical protein
MAMDLNPLLLEVLRSRAGPDSDPALQSLLSGLDPGSSGGALPSTQEMLSRLESTNPTAGLVAKYLVARQAAASETDSEDEAEAEDTTVVTATAEELQLVFDQSERLAQIVQRLERQVRKMRAELDQLRERSDTLAAALGACYLCWARAEVNPGHSKNGRPGATIQSIDFKKGVRDE